MSVRTVSGFYEQALVALPISLNLSWIVVAFFLGLTVCSRQSGWVDAAGVGGSVAWALGICLLVACAGIACACTGDVAYAFVAGWALRGIYRMQTIEDAVRFPPAALSAEVAACAFWASALVWGSALVALVFQGVRCLRPVPKVPLLPTSVSQAPASGAATAA